MPKGGSPLDDFYDDRHKHSRRHMRSRKKLIAVFYCACVVANFSDDRLKNRLVEIRLKKNDLPASNNNSSVPNTRQKSDITFVDIQQSYFSSFTTESEQVR